MRLWRQSYLVLGFVLALAGCSAMNAQNPSQGYGPVNVFPNEEGENALLGGADVVAYFTEGEYKQGSSDHQTNYKGVPIFFSSAENKALFEKTPEQYLPEYGGYCANGVMFGIPWGGNASDYRMENGKLYIFGGTVSQKAFELEMQENIKLADQYWADEIQGSNSFIQRAQRLVFRVPHYQSGAEQAELVQKANSQ
ncbi:MAG: YHS domain-containing (seleno)protein [Limnobacter sp.]|nr:YHS domain-containing (seleno)protein [Limnobacter sp.]